MSVDRKNTEDATWKDLNDQRRDFTFPTFVSRTNEKQSTTTLIKFFIDNHWPLTTECSALDIGLGEGELSYKVASAMGSKCNAIRYEGIDQSAKFVAKAKVKLQTIDIVDEKIIVGDCFGEKIGELIDHPTILIASQVVTYAPEIKEFIHNVVAKRGSISFVIGQYDESFLNVMNAKYAAQHKQVNTETTVEQALSGIRTIRYSKVLYQSEITYPENVNLTVKELTEAEYSSLEGRNLEARHILEFIAASPLEYIQHTNKTFEFSREIEKHLHENDNNIMFWNYAYMIYPNIETSLPKFNAQNTLSNMTCFNEGIEALKKSFLPNALKEGNIMAASQLNSDSNIKSILTSKHEKHVKSAIVLKGLGHNEEALSSIIKSSSELSIKLLINCGESLMTLSTHKRNEAFKKIEEHAIDGSIRAKFLLSGYYLVKALENFSSLGELRKMMELLKELSLYSKSECTARDFDIEIDVCHKISHYNETSICEIALQVMPIVEMIFKFRTNNNYKEMGAEEDFAYVLNTLSKSIEHLHGFNTKESYIGSLFYSGRLFNKSYVKAFYWFYEAAKHGDTDAQCYLGKMYRDGIGIERNDVDSLYWYNEAAKNGDIRAINYLEKMYYKDYEAEIDKNLVKGDFNQAFEKSSFETQIFHEENTFSDPISNSSNKTLIIVPMISQSPRLTMNGMANLIHNVTGRIIPAIISEFALAYLSDVYFGTTIFEFSQVKYPGTLLKYKTGIYNSSEFLQKLRYKMPDLEKVDDKSILDAWNLQSVPTKEDVDTYCTGIKKGLQYIFVSYTNPSHADAFLSAMKASCVEFKAEDHYFGLSYSSVSKHTIHRNLAQEVIDINNLRDRGIFSCNQKVIELDNTELFFIDESNLTQCLGVLEDRLGI